MTSNTVKADNYLIADNEETKFPHPPTYVLTDKKINFKTVLM